MNKKDLNKLKRPQESFKDLVADATSEKMKAFILEQVRNLQAQAIEEQNQNLQGIYERLTTLEKLVLEKTNTSSEEYAERVVDVQDDFYGLDSSAELEAQMGDVLRIEVFTKTKDQTEFQGSSRMMIQHLGSGKAIGPELEAKLIGSKKGSEAEYDFGEGMVAKISVNRVSRRRG